MGKGWFFRWARLGGATAIAAGILIGLEGCQTQPQFSEMRDMPAAVADPLLLRYALALQAEHSKELPANVEQLRDRFAASRLRGDRVHLREEARFTLHLLNAPQETLKLALENWQVQKEPADIRILLEAALAANDAAAIAVVTDWLENCRTEDVQLSRLMPAGKDRG